VADTAAAIRDAFEHTDYGLGGVTPGTETVDGEDAIGTVVSFRHRP